MPYDALIFDIDGTLWNTVPACTAGWNRALADLRAKERITPEQMISVMGTPQEESVQKLLPELYVKYPDLVEQMSKSEAMVMAEKGGEFYPGILKGIKALSQNTAVFLVSDCQLWYLDFFLNLSGLTDYITDADCYGRAKQSKAQMLVNLQKKHDFKASIYIGDTLRDQIAAKEAGFDFIFAAYGFGEVEEPCLSFASSNGLMAYLKSRRSVGTSPAQF